MAPPGPAWVAEAKEATETHLYGALSDLTNLDLRLVRYDLTSTYFEGATKPSALRVPSLRLLPRPLRRRPQVVIGLLVTGDGIPIAHHVTMVADRGLFSADNVNASSGKGFGHILATRLHRS